MTALSVGALSGKPLPWHSIDWSQYQREVRRLQTRIVKATQEGRWGKVKALQWLLTHSFSGKALAVKRVTENQGKHTPGVDRVIWSTLPSPCASPRVRRREAGSRQGAMKGLSRVTGNCPARFLEPVYDLLRGKRF